MKAAPRLRIDEGTHLSGIVSRRVGGGVCRVCDEVDLETGKIREGQCQMWQQFEQEAIAAIAAVRDFARLDKRKKPHRRSAVEVMRELLNGQV